MNTVELVGASAPGVAVPAKGPARVAVGPLSLSMGTDQVNEGDEAISLSRFGPLDSTKEVLGQVATGVRELANARKLVQRAQQQLELVVKSFPPFPPGSTEREQYLNSVAGIRSIIEKLTIPPELGEQLKQALSQPALTNSDATTDLLPAGMDGLSRAESVLAEVQANMENQVFPSRANSGEESFVVDQSKRVGAELLRQGAAISRSPEAVLALIG